MKKLFGVWLMVGLSVFGGCTPDEEPKEEDKNGHTDNTEQLGDEIDLFDHLSCDELVYVEGGTFLMGSQPDDPAAPGYDGEAYSDEAPVHKVNLSSYYIGKYEVTQGLWEYVMNYSGKAADGTQLTPEGPYWSDTYFPNDREGKGENYPVYYVSYNDIVNYFLPRLNKMTGKNFRLPTEAEWEYAARGGQQDEYTRTLGQSGTYYKYAGSNNLDEVAWNVFNSGYKSHPVGTKAPNALGLYDMSSNVWEWCNDRYNAGYYEASPEDNPAGPAIGMYRVMRGGYWGGAIDLCRVSRRYNNSADSRNYYYGLRLALPL